MKAVFVILLLASIICSQEITVREPDGFGAMRILQPSECLSAERRISILEANRSVKDSLRKANPSVNNFLNSGSSVLFSLPLRPAPGLQDSGFYTITSFPDHDPAYPDHLLDYNGGRRTYDLSGGYNHKGTDYIPWPFVWYKMDYNQVEVIAAERGVIIGKEDGNYDRNCEISGNPWNAVYIAHSDNSVAWYGHLKKHTLTSKPVGSVVEKGEYLGFVGSSGSSSAPHLHLEVYDQNNQLIDPYYGPFNPTTSVSWWGEQEPYFNSMVNAVFTHGAAPVFPPCPQQEILNLKDNFMQGEKLYLAAYYKDHCSADTSKYTVFYPEGTVANQWLHSLTDSFYAATYLYWYFTIPLSFPSGEYTFRVDFKGRVYQHRFNIGQPGGVNGESESPAEFILRQNRPNPFNASTMISFAVPELCNVRLTVYNLAGREMAVLINEMLGAGEHTVRFDASALPSGTYIYKITAGKYNAASKMSVVK